MILLIIFLLAVCNQGELKLTYFLHRVNVLDYEKTLEFGTVCGGISELSNC